MQPKSLLQSIQDVENKLIELIELFNNSGNSIVLQKLNEIIQIVSEQQTSNTLSSLIGKVDVILQYVTPEVIPISPEQKAAEALQVLTNLQLQLAQQSVDIPAPDRPWMDDNCNMKVWFPNKTILTMLKLYKGLVDFALGGQFVIDWTDIGVFIYLNWIDADAETAIVSSGGKIIQKI